MSLFGTPNIDDMKAHWVEVEKNKNNLDEIEKIYIFGYLVCLHF